MNIETYRDYCLEKDWVSEGFPFDGSTLVFKVLGKIFALTNVDSFTFINLKCDPERAIELRESNPGIQPGYHMNKQQWNSVYTDGEVTDPLILELIDHSYDLILNSIPQKKREALKKELE
jgi:predicted DNA-binding protein (MmcQ/YjbR family)